MPSYLPKLPLRLGRRDKPAHLCPDASREMGTARGQDRMQALGIATLQSKAGRPHVFLSPGGGGWRKRGLGKGSFLLFRITDLLNDGIALFHFSYSLPFLYY